MVSENKKVLHYLPRYKEMTIRTQTLLEKARSSNKKKQGSPEAGMIFLFSSLGVYGKLERRTIKTNFEGQPCQPVRQRQR